MKMPLALKLNLLEIFQIKFSITILTFLLFTSFVGRSQSPIDMEVLSKLYGDDLIRAEVIENSSLRSLNNKEEITLELFADVTINAKKNKSVKYAKGYELWRGTLSGYQEGYLELFSRNGLVSGTVYTNSNVYKLDGTIEGSLRVIELNHAELSDHFEIEEEDELAKSNETPIRSSKILATTVATPTNPITIDVMVIYPLSVQQSMGGAEQMENEVHYRIAEANEAFSNSNVYVEFRLAHHQLVTSVDEDADGSSDVKTNEVKKLRDQYKADLVSFWNQDGSTGSASNFDDFPGDPSDGFSTANFSAIQSQYTFIHECAHNMGAKHDRQTYYEDDPRNSKLNLKSYYRYGKSFVGYRSIMSYNSCGELSGGSSRDCERIPYFTNPDIIVNGAPFGVQGDFQTYDVNGPSNNAKRINEVAPYVAAYYDNEDVSYTELVVNNGLGSGFYETGDVVTIIADEPAENMLFHQWTGDIGGVTDINSSSTSILINAADVSVEATYKEDGILAVEDHELVTNVSIFPNPAENLLNVDLKGVELTTIDIINLSGQIVFSQKIKNGLNQVNIEDISIGFYLVKLTKENQTYTTTFVKQ